MVAVLAAACVALGGCAATWNGDGVLWRQLVEQKAALPELRAPDREALTEAEVKAAVKNGERAEASARGGAWLYWTPGDDELGGDLNAGAVFFYDFETHPRGERRSTFGALLYSGDRNAPADSLAGADRYAPYDGPNAVFTCERFIVTYLNGRVDDVLYPRVTEDVQPCPEGLVDLLPSGAVYAKPEELDG